MIWNIETYFLEIFVFRILLLLKQMNDIIYSIIFL